jgi:hypothetical protein
MGLFDAINSFFTPAGTNARRKQEQGQQDIGNIGGDIARGAGADYLGAMKFGRGFDPQMQDGIRYLANSTTTAGLRNNAITAGNAARSQALSQQPIPGLNSFAAQGIRANNLSHAQDMTNAGINNAYSPQAHLEAMHNLMQVLDQYKRNYGSSLQLGANLAYGQPQVPVQPGILDYAAPYFGSLMGGHSVGSG